MEQRDINYTKEAFLNPWNLGMVAVAMLTVLLLFTTGTDLDNNLVLLFAAAAELIYLGVVPRSERFRRAVRAKKAAERHKPLSPKEIYRRLTREDQKRYVRLRNLEKSIRANYRKLSYASQGLLDSHLDKIEGLLDSYLRLLYQQERFRDHADAASESEVRRSIEALRRKMDEDSGRVEAINKRRLRVLKQRLASFKKGRENLEIIEAQLETITDVIKYIHEQSWTLKNPDEITLQLDTLLDEVEETQASVAEVEEVFSRSSDDLLSDIDSYGDLGADERTAETERTRSREA